MRQSFRRRSIVLFLLFALSATTASADATFVRWTGAEDSDANLAHVVSVASAKTGFGLAAEDFTVIEDRDLANNHFRMLVQTAAGIPIRGASIRIWTDLALGGAIQVEANLERPAGISSLRNRASMFAGMDTATLNQPTAAALRVARAAVNQHRDDREQRTTKWSLVWDSGRLKRIVKIKGRRGTHTLELALPGERLVKQSYEEFPQGDSLQNGDSEFSVHADVYPIYEEVEGPGTMQPRVRAELKYLKSRVSRSAGDPFAELRSRRYFEDKLDAILGETEAGRAQGYWSSSYIKRVAERISSQLPVVDNSFTDGVSLMGRYATISLHPAVTEKFVGIEFTPGVSARFKPEWRETEVAGEAVWEMIPMGALLGRPLRNEQESLARPARRLPKHDPVAYINDGFDELQVYYAINTLFDALKPMGFTDPDLSTRPFNAFLFDPDLSMRDNAFYTDDTINFTTYSDGTLNMARDNPTIWHELGHGVMDRLMGDLIQLADTGGLSEGMADFVAQLVVEAVTDGNAFPGSTDFRIMNKTGFFLTNEVHDDGEAYGGAMRDIMQSAIDTFGRPGLAKIADLTLESMRLCRNHPGLTAQEWFSHMLFADELGRAGVRAPGELRETVLGALAGRNFTLDGKPAAAFVVKNGDDEVTSSTPGSRGKPIPLELAADGSATFHLSAQVVSTEAYRFVYPVTVKVFHKSGALQGAIQWEGEEIEPKSYVLETEADVAKFDVTAHGTCDYSNRDDGSCVDYVYVQAWNAGETRKPQAKKRFYLRVKGI